jgi:hypothetical protein
VLTFQTQSGCELKPLIGHAVAGEHGEHALIPLENVPIGQVVDVKAHDVAPWVLKDPGLQGWQTTEEFAPMVVENVPAEQGIQVELITAPTKLLHVPAAHGAQADTEAAPDALLNVPAGQLVGLMEENGQNEP